MKTIFFLAHLLLIYGVNCFTTPEECLKELNCNDELNCVASCYNVPAPDQNSVVKTADCQNGCLAKYPNNLPTDWANLNQCYLDCVQNNYFNSPAEYIAATTANNNNNNSNTSTGTTTEINNNNSSNNNNNSVNNNNSNSNTTDNSNNNNDTNGTNGNINNTNNDGNNSNNLNGNINNNGTIIGNGSNFNQTNNTNDIGHPINATDHLPNVIVDENSLAPGFSYIKTFLNVALIFMVYLIFY